MLRWLVIGICLILVVGCSAPPVMQGRKLVDEGNYDLARDILYAEVDRDPANTRAWRELGRSYFHEGNMEKAEVCFTNAAVDDPLALWYIGRIHEQQGETDRAIEVYIQALEQTPSGNTKALIRKQLDDLLQQELQNRLPKVAAASEAELDVSTVPENTIAVLNFDGSRLNDDVAPIAYGVSEFIAADLAKVKSLKSVERLKIEAILSEHRLRELGYTDKLSAVQSGRLIGARRIVTGQMVSLGEEVQIGGVVVDIVRDTANRTETDQTRLEQLFRLQKRFVFAVLDSLGVRLTAEERNAIMEVPTENYLAFLAYSRGLQFRDHGDLEMARDEFERASGLDAGFSAAAGEAASTTALIVGSTLGPVTVGSIEAAAYQEFAGAISGGQVPIGGLDYMLSNILNNSGATRTGSEESDKGNTDTDKDPDVQAVGSANVTGNLDGD
jgi:tetratricopeptide (TPR) repeat protein